MTSGLCSPVFHTNKTERVNNRQDSEEKAISKPVNWVEIIFDKIESHATTTSVSFLDSEQTLLKLYEERTQLLEKRNKLLKLPFSFLRFKLKKQHEIINTRLDSIEFEIVKLQREEWKKEAKSIESLIADNERFIQEIAPSK